jgi:hypothetical protein
MTTALALLKPQTGSTMRILIGLIAIVVIALTGDTVQAAMPPGPGVLVLPELVGRKVAPLTVHLYRPAKWTVNDRVLIVMHGRNRDGANYRDQWTDHAIAFNILVVVPEFDEQNFPGAAAYNYGSMVDDEGRPQPADNWAIRERYSLYGHSAGAQFVHRFLLLARASDADLIICANAGAYTMLDRDVSFPFGLRGIEVSDDDLRRSFSRQVIILLGDADIDPSHSSLPRQPGAMAQGPHRLARGRMFFATSQAKAAALGAPFQWQMMLVPGAGHSNMLMAIRASQIVANAGR